MSGPLAALLLACAPVANVHAATCPSTHRRWFQFGEGEKLFAKVQVGWTTQRLRALLGDPRSCEGKVWTYSAGLPDGPLLTYSFTIDQGRVTHIEQASAACIFRE